VNYFHGDRKKWLPVSQAKPPIKKEKKKEWWDFG
jgi:hypothetical protein